MFVRYSVAPVAAPLASEATMPIDKTYRLDYNHEKFFPSPREDHTRKSRLRLSNAGHWLKSQNRHVKEEICETVFLWLCWLWVSGSQP